MGHLWGIDLGGTKIEGIVMPDADRPEPLARFRIETEAHLGYDHVVSRIGLMVSQLREATGLSPEAIGIGTPGSANPHTGLMRNCNTTCLNGKPLPLDLQLEIGVPVAVANDANCFALAEALWGAGRGFETVWGVILGTGVGGGLVVGGTVLNGANGIAGEWGHTIHDLNGPPCYCGRNGCVETFLSGPANERRYRELTGETLPFQDIVRLSRENPESAAGSLLDEYLQSFGKAIAQVVNVFDPHVVVLGGGVGQMDELYTLGRQNTEGWVFSDQFETPFRRPELGDSAGVFGAALLPKSVPLQKT